jgi:hypothetical protein
MITKLSVVTIDNNENSSIKSPAWETSGIASGSQALNRTSGLPIWTDKAGTAVGRLIEYYISPDVKDEDTSKLLLKDKRFRKSIERAREQMRRGSLYLRHNDIFGE